MMLRDPFTDLLNNIAAKWGRVLWYFKDHLSDCHINFCRFTSGFCLPLKHWKAKTESDPPLIKCLYVLFCRLGIDLIMHWFLSYILILKVWEDGEAAAEKNVLLNMSELLIQKCMLLECIKWSYYLLAHFAIHLWDVYPNTSKMPVIVTSGMCLERAYILQWQMTPPPCKLPDGKDHATWSQSWLGFPSL